MGHFIQHFLFVSLLSLMYALLILQDFLFVLSRSLCGFYSPLFSHYSHRMLLDKIIREKKQQKKKNPSKIKTDLNFQFVISAIISLLVYFVVVAQTNSKQRKKETTKKRYFRFDILDREEN